MLYLRAEHDSEGYSTPVGWIGFIFHGGKEIQVRIDEEMSGVIRRYGRVVITAHIRSSNDLMELLLITDALRRINPFVKIHLECPYLPYARQDRVCETGEAFSLRVIADILNLQNYEKIVVWDVHSDVAMGVLNRCENVSAASLIPKTITEDSVLVAPDAGAMKRVLACAKAFSRPMITAEKIRNTNTGEITETKVHSGPIGDQSFLIIDDICDGGRTFTELAKVLRPLTTGKINLWVTHGIFSQGFGVFDGLIDNIYVANCFHNDAPNNVFITKGKTR